MPLLCINHDWNGCWPMYRYLQERIRQVEDERGHALSTISKYKVLINAVVFFWQFCTLYIQIIFWVLTLDSWCKRMFRERLQWWWKVRMRPRDSRFPTPPGKSRISFCKISRPWRVLENVVKGPGKSCNFLGYNVGGGHNDAGADARICKY